MNLKPINDAIAALAAEHGAMPRDMARVKLAEPLLAARAALLDLERMNDAEQGLATLAESNNRLLHAALADRGMAIIDLSAKLAVSQFDLAVMQRNFGAANALADDLRLQLTASQDEAHQLRAEAGTCAAGAAELHAKLTACEEECAALRAAGTIATVQLVPGELIFADPAAATLHAILAGVIASVGTEDGPALGDAVRNAAKAFKFGLAVFGAATISPEALAADESFASTAAKLRAANAELDRLRADAKFGVYPHPPAGAKFGRWEPVIGSQNPAWVESRPSNASGLPG